MNLRRPLRAALAVLAVLALGCVLLAGFVVWRHLAPMDVPPSKIDLSDPAQVRRGEYLARAGNCIACHSLPGQTPYSGGSAIATPFGDVSAPNLTPDRDTGLGRWSADDFWRALHHGRSRAGRLLYPAFPYPNYTRMPRDDVDAVYAYLRTLPAVRRAAQPHAMRFPYNTQAALAVWRGLFFTPGVQQPVAERSTAWNRGAYLVEGPAHCMACHGSRNLLGATVESGVRGGSLLSAQRWYAPSLHAATEAGVAHWAPEDVVALLQTGFSPRGRAQGPMAEVVFHGTQYLVHDDLLAMATYLQDLPQERSSPRRDPIPPPPQAVRELGATLYRQHCADCHGEQGQGSVGGVYPALAGNRLVTMAQPDNLVRTVLEGGFGPSTAGRPRPYGMPPFEQQLDNDQMAALLSYLRSTWGNEAEAVSPLDVMRRR